MKKKGTLTMPIVIKVSYVIGFWQAIKLRIAGFHKLPRHKITIDELMRKPR